MKKLLLILATVLVAFSSCKTNEKVIYFQDLQQEEVIHTQAQQALTFLPGDKLSIIVSSARTPQLSQQFNLPIVSTQAGATSTSSGNQVALYTIDDRGDVDFPVLGKIHLQGLTRSQVADKIQELIRAGQVNDAVVTVTAYDQYVTVMGEVKSPGRIKITNEHLSLLEAIGQVGDLTIQGRRDRVLVIRQEGANSKTYYVDLRSKELFNSPVYNLRQNDVIYVEPNKMRTAQSTNNGNSVRSISTWLSISSFLLSLGILIFR